VVEATEDDSGKRKYDVRGSVRISAIEVRSLRIMRQGQTMSFYFVDAKGKPHKVSKAQVGTAAVASRGLRLSVHTGGDGNMTKVLWKKLTLPADGLTD